MYHSCKINKTDRYNIPLMCILTNNMYVSYLMVPTWVFVCMFVFPPIGIKSYRGAFYSCFWSSYKSTLYLPTIFVYCLYWTNSIWFNLDHDNRNTWYNDWFDFWCLNATFNNISAISWRPVLVVEEAIKVKIQSRHSKNITQSMDSICERSSQTYYMLVLHT